MLNIIEYLVQGNKGLKEEKPRLRDENNRLKGAQGKPNICLQIRDISSESERKKLKKSKSKKHKIKTERTIVCKIDKTQLPPDTVFKDRFTVLEILMQGQLNFKFDGLPYAWMECTGLPNNMLCQLKQRMLDSVMNKQQTGLWSGRLFPTLRKHHRSRRSIREADALSACQQSSNAISILLTDDAPQFKGITEHLALYWVHDRRHYKESAPIVPRHKMQLETFLKQHWEYYHKLLEALWRFEWVMYNNEV